MHVSVAVADPEWTLCMAVLDETATLASKRSTLEGWPASRSLADLGGPPSQGFSALAPAFALRYTPSEGWSG